MALPYRTRRVLSRIGIVLLVLLLAAIVTWLVWLLWLDRYVVYSADGAKLDLSMQSSTPVGEAALPPETKPTVPLIYNGGENALSTSTELTQLYGYYIDADALSDSMDYVLAQTGNLPSSCAVMLDMKSIYGNFFYNTAVGKLADTVNQNTVESLVRTLKEQHHYLIARIPAFQDFNFGLTHVEYGLPVEEGYLWQDDEGCYWLNPTSSGTLNYLISIVQELKQLGFDEVVFSSFRFPETDSIVFDGDRTDALNTAAATLYSGCATATFAVSFEVAPNTVTLPQGRCRQYLADIGAVNIKSTADSIAREAPEIYLVFLAESNDTRYDDYGVLRLITSVHFDEN